MAPPPLVDPALAAFVQGGVSMIAASRGDDGAPSVMRGVGCRVSEDRRQLTLLMSAAGCGRLLDDLRAGGPIAVVFARPSTHEAVQLKAARAVVSVGSAADWALATRWQQRFAVEIAPLGFGLDFVMAAFGWRPGDLHAICFEPTEAYDQTPGAKAGTPLAGAAR